VTAARYALYLAPPPDTPLWAFGSGVIGYDAATGRELHGFAPEGHQPAAWRAMTEAPRLYGFHATLKAPFRLAEGAALAALENELATFTAMRAAFDLGPLAVEAIGSGQGFAALVPTRPSPELQDLETEAVAHFDRFRAPPTAEEIAKRRPHALTERQRASLERFGYPYVGPDFRFHMTLSGPVADAPGIADRLADAMANAIGSAHLLVEALVLFEQPAPGERFRIRRRFGFARA
jgi:hypothetical protein